MDQYDWTGNKYYKYVSSSVQQEMTRLCFISLTKFDLIQFLFYFFGTNFSITSALTVADTLKQNTEAPTFVSIIIIRYNLRISFCANEMTLSEYVMTEDSSAMRQMSTRYRYSGTVTVLPERTQKVSLYSVTYQR